MLAAKPSCDVVSKLQHKRATGMKVIRDRFSGKVLWQTEAPTLKDADLAGKVLSRANLSNEDLSGANLTGAFLVDTLFDGANLTDADLTGAVLIDAAFRSAVFKNTELARAKLSNITFASCLSLHEAVGLDQVEFGPKSCTFDLPTLVGLFEYARPFLSKLGLTSDEVEKLSRIFPQTPQRPDCSVFLSYTQSDHKFAEKLHKDLFKHGIRCFNYNLDVEVGEISIRGRVAIGDQPSQEQINQTELRKILIDHFNDDELRDLCFDLDRSCIGIDYDDLPGEGRRGKVRELIKYAKRHNCITELVKMCRDLRSYASWQNVILNPLFEQTHLREQWRNDFEQAILEYDTLIVVCSRSSLARASVAEEILLVLEKEAIASKLLPVAIDDFIFTASPDDILNHLPSDRQRWDWVTRLKQAGAERGT